MPSFAARPLNRFFPVITGGLVAGLYTVMGAAANPPGQPNIVIILADDMGFSDIGCYGSEISTPNLDRLAAHGLRFTQFYNTGRCCPTRASLLTGLYPHQAGVGHMVNDQRLPGYLGRLNDRCVTIAEALQPAGYFSGVAGKWHVTPFVYVENRGPHRGTWPLQRGFDAFHGTLAGGGDYFDPIGYVVDNEYQRPADDIYYTDLISDAAVEFVDRAAQLNRRLFLYVAYTAPHWPLHALESDIQKYQGVYDLGWDELRRRRLERMQQLSLIDDELRLTPRDPQVPAWEQAEHKAWEARRMAVYAAQIDRLDQGVGRIVGALQRRGMLDNTLILFLADNGACAEIIGRADRFARPGTDTSRWGTRPDVMPGPRDTFQSYGSGWANASNTPLRLYKHYVHEGGIATPLIAHWPARITARGELRHQPGHVVDVLATCLQITGVSYPDQMRGQATVPPEGRSLLPVFDNQPIEREALYWEHEGNRAVRMGDWKLVANGRRGPWELYDLATDRTEMRNLAAEHPDRVQRLAAMWEAWAGRAQVKPWPGN